MNWDIIVTVGIAAIGATWAIRSKLSDIETKLDSRVSKFAWDVENHELRIVKLEEYRNARR